MFKILIIDDDSSREAELNKIFKHESFTLEFVFEKKIFFEKERSFEKYDCIACDISLDKWIESGDTTNMFDTVLKTIGKDIPIVIFSSVVKEVIKWTNRILEERYPLIYTIALREVNNRKEIGKKLRGFESNQIICNNIFTLLHRKGNFSALKKEQNESVNILHISDLQFGDSEFEKNLGEAFLPVLKGNISKGTIPKIDLIAITGDISYNGRPSQYDEAFKWITNLCSSIFGENFHDRLLLVPGNHDANLSICSLNHFVYHYPEDKEPEGIIKFDDLDEAINDYSSYSMDPFRDFAYRLTNDINWLENESLSFFNFKFCYLGFKILQLNTVVPDNQLGKKDAVFELNNTIISSLRDNMRKNNNLIDIPTIVLSHPSPAYIGYDMGEEHKKNWVSVSNFLSEINAILYTFGHRHKNLLKDEIPLNAMKNLKICGTGTLLCEPDKGDRRGFKIIELKRQDSRIIDVCFNHYDYKNDATIKLD